MLRSALISTRKIAILLFEFMLISFSLHTHVFADGPYNFAGFDWYTRSSDRQLPPPDVIGNYWLGQEGTAVDFLDSDANGVFEAVKLSIYPNENGEWSSAQIYTDEADIKYGRYCFYVDAFLDELHPSLVFGMFLYDEMGNPGGATFREADIEFTSSFWEENPRNYNAQFAVQRKGVEQNPDTRTHSNPYQMQFGQSLSTHCINWREDAVSFRSYEGYVDPSAVAKPKFQWEYEPGKQEYNRDLIPREGTTKLVINLWIATPPHPDPAIVPNSASPDGIYQVTITDVMYSVSPASNLADLRYVSAENLSAIGDTKWMTVSPDGSKLLWVENEEGFCLHFFAANRSSCVQPPDSIRAHGFQDLTWSPSSRYVAFTEVIWRELNDGDIWLFDAQEQTFRNLTEDGFDGSILVSPSGSPPYMLDYVPFWNPLNGDLYFFRSTCCESRLSLYRIAVESVSPTAEFVLDLHLEADNPASFPIYNNSERSSLSGSAAISPNGRYFAILVRPPNQWQQYKVWVLELKAGAVVRKISVEDLNHEGLPSWQGSAMLWPDSLAWTRNSQGLVIGLFNPMIVTNQVYAGAAYVELETGAVRSLQDFSAVASPVELFQIEEATGIRPAFDIPLTSVLWLEGSAMLYTNSLTTSVPGGLSGVSLGSNVNAPVRLHIIPPGDVEFSLMYTASIGSDGRFVRVCMSGYLFTFESSPPVNTTVDTNNWYFALSRSASVGDDSRLFAFNLDGEVYTLIEEQPSLLNYSVRGWRLASQAALLPLVVDGTSSLTFVTPDSVRPLYSEYETKDIDHFSRWQVLNFQLPYIVFAIKDQSGIYVDQVLLINVITGTVEPLPGVLLDAPVSISRDGKYLYYLSKDSKAVENRVWTLWKRTLAGGEQQAIRTFEGTQRPFVQPDELGERWLFAGPENWELIYSDGTSDTLMEHSRRYARAFVVNDAVFTYDGHCLEIPCRLELLPFSGGIIPFSIPRLTSGLRFVVPITRVSDTQLLVTYYDNENAERVNEEIWLVGTDGSASLIGYLSTAGVQRSLETISIDKRWVLVVDDLTAPTHFRVWDIAEQLYVAEGPYDPENTRIYYTESGFIVFDIYGRETALLYRSHDQQALTLPALEGGRYVELLPDGAVLFEQVKETRERSYGIYRYDPDLNEYVLLIPDASYWWLLPLSRN